MGSKRRMGKSGGLQVHSWANSGKGRIMKQSNEKICPTCMCSKIEYRTITNPMANVFGWHLVDYERHLYSRRCKRCNGTGFVPIAKSVPTIPRVEDDTTG